MKILTNNVTAIHEIKGSKFLTYFEPFSIDQNVRIRQEELREIHFKCVHVVYASRVLNEFGQIVENQSDDGEPKGSSGTPALNVLRGADIINCVCYIVRYFGGTLLGVGGLVRAYSLSVNLGINEAIKNNYLSIYIKKDDYLVEIDYAMVNKFSYILDNLNISYDKEFLHNVFFTLHLSEDELKLLEFKIKDLRIELVKI
ncbi:YigZ family protein [Campylobacter sp. MG1]|uniref:YigZ family protein n=1 Tax=Campylobacter sp. MG1 TaxID=2976332 RepID=UPI00226CE1A6|nr:YigZ family protein [Campylobacter sp. MG1]